jgi:hypothetical protein
MCSQTPNRPHLNGIDDQGPAVDTPAGPRAQVLVVVAQVPDEVRRLGTAHTEMMCDARDPAQCVVGVGAGGIDLADDRMLGAGDFRQRCHCRADTVATLMVADGLKRPRRIRQS